MINKEKWLSKQIKTISKNGSKEEAAYIVLLIYSSINDTIYFDNLFNVAISIYDHKAGKLSKTKNVCYEDLALLLNMNTKTLLKKRKILENVCLHIYNIFEL